MELSPTQKLVQKFFKDETGQPILLSPLQDQLFQLIFLKKHPRIHVMAHTRFGKSLTIALAVLTRAATFPEKWGIIAGTKEKASIIMGYINFHLFDHPFFLQKFIPEKGGKIEDLRRYRNKSRITLKLDDGKYSEIFIGSAHEVMGEGAKNVVLDEAALVDDPDFSFVLRMLGDDPKENFLVKVGNPFRRNHFLKSWKDPKYLKFNVDCWTSLKEGWRMSEAIIEENKGYPFFSVLYENKFPAENEIDEEGWVYLLTESDLKIAQSRKNLPAGERILGVDIARGGRNQSVWVLRDETQAQILSRDNQPDLIETGKKTKSIILKMKLEPENVFIDDVGVGGGVVDFLHHQGLPVNGVNFGMRATLTARNSREKKQLDSYLNIRSVVYAGEDSVLTWIKNYGQLIGKEGWEQLLEIRFRKNAAGKVMIESKERMRKRGVESPDVADALALTFAKQLHLRYNRGGMPRMTNLQSLEPISEFGGVKPLYDDFPG